MNTHHDSNFHGKRLFPGRSSPFVLPLISTKLEHINERFCDTFLADNPDLANDDYVEENVAILHIYHNDLHFLKRERGEVSI